MLRRVLATALFASSVIAAGVSTDVRASSVTVVSGAELRTAISDANADDAITEILVDADTIDLGLGVIECGTDEANATGDLDFTGSQGLTIRGIRTDRSTIEQHCDDRILDHRGSGTLTVQNIQLLNGQIASVPLGTGADPVDYSGGGIRSGGGDLVIVDVRFKNNRAGSADDTISGFGNAQAPGNGGGIYSTGDVTVTDSSFADNAAGRGGDGDSNLPPTNGGHGGAIFVAGGTLSVSDTQFISNGAGRGGRGDETTGGLGGSGGAIYADEVVLADVVFEDEPAGDGGPSNDARGGDGGDGGAVFATVSVSATRTSILNSNAGYGGTGNDNGGAVAVGEQGIGGTGGDGGAIHAPQVTLTESLVSAVTAGDGGESTNDQGGEGGDGGAIWGRNITLTDTHIESSRAGDGGDGPLTRGGGGGNGGAVAAAGTPDSTIDATRSYFENNRAGDGGAGTTSGGGTQGGSGGDGGALAYVPGPPTEPNRTVITLDDSVLDGNTSGSGGVGIPVGFFGRGGAIFNANNENGATTARNTTFVRNAIGTGATVERTGSALSVDNVTLTFVTITDNGGPAALDTTRTTFLGFDYVTASVIGENAGANCSDTVLTQSGGFNVIDDTSCTFGGTEQNPGTSSVPAADIGLDPITDGPTPPLGLGSPDADPDGVGRLPTEDGPLDEYISVADCDGQFRINAISSDQWGATRPGGDGCEPGALEIGVPAVPDPDPDPDPADQLDDAARFVPLAPVRLFDTRDDQPAAGPKGLVAPDSSIDVQITGVGGVPNDAVAVVMNVAAINATNGGFVTIWAAGQPQPLAATHNLTAPGQTRPNLVTVPIGTDGKVSIYTQRGAHFAGDVAGYYEDTDTATTAGRVVSVQPARLFDTRPTETESLGPKGVLGAGDTIEVQVTGVAGVPTTGVAAVVMNLAGINATGKGFVTAYPTGDDRPLAAVLNLNAPGETNSNLVMLPVGTDGKVSLYSSSGTHLSGDVTAYVTDTTAASDTVGLFVPLDPTRAFDTRPTETESNGPKGFVDADTTIDGSLGIEIGIPSTASGAVLNVAGVAAAGKGFVTGYPAGTDRPLSATLNLAQAGDVRPNAAVLPIGTDDEISFYSQSGTHLVIDTSGYFLG